MEDLPKELKVIISQFLDSQSKFNIKITNSAWRHLVTLDSFKVNGATSENLPRIIDTYSKIQQPVSLEFKNFKDITISDFVDQVTKLTNLIGLEFDRISDQSYWRDRNNPWLKFQVMTQLTRFQPWFRSRYPFQIMFHLTNLKEFRYNAVTWEHEDERMKIRRINYVIPLLTQLESLELHIEYFDKNPFHELVTNPSRLTELLLAGETYKMTITSEELKRFGNLKRLKLDMNTTIEIEHFTALEDLKLIRHGNINYNFEYNKMLTRLFMKSQSIDDNINATLKHLTKMKNLEFQFTNQNNQIRQDSSFAFLSEMTHLQTFKINTNQLVSGELFSFANSQNLKTMKWSFDKDVDISALAKFSSLRVLTLTQNDTEASVSYDPISNLVNLNCLKITGISSTHNATFISTLTMLKILAIESKNDFGGDLDLSQLPNLESLDILGTTSADVIPTISSTKISRLCCPLQPGTDYDLLLTHPLLHLQITNDNEEFLLWKAIEQLTSLQRLALFKVYEFKKLLQLINLTDLRVLEFTNLKKIPTSYYTKLTSLKGVICNENTVYTCE